MLHHSKKSLARDNPGRATKDTQSLVPRRSRTHAERRDEAERRILSAAVEIISEAGLEALTLAGAGERAGYSRGLAGHYFGGRDELVSAITTSLLEPFFDEHIRLVERYTGIEALEKTVSLYFTRTVQNVVSVRAFHVILAGGLHNPSIATTVANLSRESVAGLVGIITAGMENGQFRKDLSPECEARLILAALRGVVLQWFVDPQGVDLDEMASSLFGQLKKRFLSD